MNPWNSIPNIGEGRARTAMPEHGAPYGAPGSKVSIAPLLHPAHEVIPEVTSQEDEAFQALPAMTADQMRGAEGMSDQMNWAFDRATHDMHERVAAGMADLADQMDGVFKPTPYPPLALHVEEAAASVFAGMKVTEVSTLPPGETHFMHFMHFMQGGKLVGRIVNAAPPHDSLEEAQMAAGWPQEAQPATVAAFNGFAERLAAPDPELAGQKMPGLTGRIAAARPAPTGIDATLAERGSRYGKFEDHAAITMQLKNALRQRIYENTTKFQADQLEAIDMICHKLGRIVNGDPNYADSWADIAGYAKLVADRLEGVSR